MISEGLESDIREHFVKVSKRNRIWPVKITPFGERGFPDHLCLGFNAVVFFVELKRPKRGVVRKMQDLKHRLLRQMGFNVYILNTKAKVDAFYQEKPFQP